MRWKMLCAVAAPMCLAAAAPATPFGPSLFTGADPDLEKFIVKGELQYVIYTTNMDVHYSKDAITWTKAPALFDIDDVTWLTAGEKDSRGLWAPDMERGPDGRYYLYFSVGPANRPGGSRIGVQICDGPLGPCTGQDRSFELKIEKKKGLPFERIDPAYFYDPVGKQGYLYAGGSAGSNVRVFKMTSMTQLGDEVTPAVQPADSADDDANEHKDFTEGAFMHMRRDANGTPVYYLSYSNGSYTNQTYNVRYVTASSPAGPWNNPSKVILKTGGDVYGPGHHAFFYEPKLGRWIIAYHRYDTPDGTHTPDDRKVALARVTYSGAAINPIDLDAQ